MNILLLTSIYPSKEGNVNLTPVVHYFAKEWVKLGHEVLVIHSTNQYFKFFHSLPTRFYKILERFMGAAIENNILPDSNYKIENVNVLRISIKKKFPHGDYSKNIIEKHFVRIIEKIGNYNFTPDVVIGHWEVPQISLVSLLKRYYSIKGVIILHVLYYVNKKNNHYIKELKNIDIIGFRSSSLQKHFYTKFWVPKKDFICYSGIPIESKNLYERKSFKANLDSIIYVGMLINRKYPDKLLDVFIKYKKRNMGKTSLNFIGEGNLIKKMKKTVAINDVDKYVKFYGRISREEVFSLMKKSECFVMISKNEAFGLVYLEAMLHGCLVIASKKEGMDGIIIDKENGFLCEAGNETELLSIFEHIDSLSIIEKEKISINAIKTALNFSERNVAQMYLNALK